MRGSKERQAKLHRLGERIVRNRLRGKLGSWSFPIRVKTKPCTWKFHDTGFDVRFLEEYEKQNPFVYFVCVKHGEIHYSPFADLEPTRREGGIQYYDFSKMARLSSLTKEEVHRIEVLSERNPEWNERYYGGA